MLKNAAGEGAVWSLDDAIDFCRRLREFVRPLGFDVGLTGSCLHTGKSVKDVDVIIYPLKRPAATSFDVLRSALASCGWLQCVKEREQMRYGWTCRDGAAADTKWVEMWRHCDKRVDIFFME